MSVTVGSFLPSLFRDLAAGLNQQMFFWGKDAAHPEGNLFVRTGFAKSPSAGIQGTSCYRLAWEGGWIELHGSYAGWLGGEGGALFVRPLGRCVRWLDATAPVPGKWPKDRYVARSDHELYEKVRPFLNWWLAHESEVARLGSSDFRDVCYRHYKNLPRTRAWLSPDLAEKWVAAFRDHPDSLPRARRFTGHLCR